jgi:hypothetical protein
MEGDVLMCWCDPTIKEPWCGRPFCRAPEVPPAARFDPEIHVPGMWQCERCNFGLVQSTMNANTGEVRAQVGKEGGFCPNCSLPLRRTTWREHAEALAKRGEEAITEAAGLRREVAALHASLLSMIRSARVALADFDVLTGHSGGVYGLHLNGDLAPWGELLAGGRLCAWTAGIAHLRDTLAAHDAEKRRQSTAAAREIEKSLRDAGMQPAIEQAKEMERRLLSATPPMRYDPSLNNGPPRKDG